MGIALLTGTLWNHITDIDNPNSIESYPYYGAPDSPTLCGRREWRAGIIQDAICFLPKSRASIDHAPGPIIAKVPPKTANTNDDSLPAPVKALHSWMMTISPPARGVQKPTRINNPSTAPIIWGRIGADAGTWLSATIPWISSTRPVTSR